LKGKMKTTTMADAENRSEPTETSPLLAPHGGQNAKSLPDGDSSGPNGSFRGDEEAVGSGPPDAGQNAESQDDSTAKQQIRYILPAISIGVCCWTTNLVYFVINSPKKPLRKKKII
jgi:hypothetical protein